jgi:rare lipoprotein A
MKSSLLSALICGACAWFAFPAQLCAQAGNAATKTVTASFYSTRYDGRRTASGERFNSNDLTAAHRELPFGTKVKLTNVGNQKSVVVRVNDRGPFVKSREISVTRLAAQRLGFTKAGTTQVTMEVLGAAKP